MKRTIRVYTLLVVVFGLIISATLELGQRTYQPHPSATIAATTTSAPSNSSTEFPPILSALRDNLQEPLGRLLLQFLFILIATRVLGSLFRRIGQPGVIGELIAGILLGPSLLGRLAPNVFSFVFPTSSLGNLQLLSQIGVCLFMFVIGMELDLSQIRQRAHVALFISHTSILFPYLLGVLMALWLYASYAGPNVPFLAFGLFMGIAMSLTAFPVLVRILEDRGMIKTMLGSTVITAAAVGDATAWMILACVVAIARSAGLGATIFNLALVIVFVSLMVWVVRPRLSHRFNVNLANGRRPGSGLIVFALFLMIGSALIAQAIGIHALFGAFLAGLIMPRKKALLEFTIVRLDNLTRLFLLPLFFAFSGLRTHVDSLSDASSWLVCLSIIVVATAGKLGGTVIAARLTDLGWNEAFSLGALMNTRGLVELVALNIGYDLGILSPTIFTMMVLMALCTTMSTGPLLNLAEYLKRRALVPVAAQPVTNL